MSRKQILMNDLLKWPKARLINCIRGLEKELGIGSQERKRRGQKRGRFDMEAYRRRKIALLLSYDGAGYNGFASQQETDNTTENVLFAALKKTCLIVNEDECNYSRCGRTDKEVNGMGQVLSLDIRSNLRKGIVFAPALLESHNLCKEEGKVEGEQLEIKVQTDFRGEHVEAVVNISKDAKLNELLVASDKALGIACDDISHAVVGDDKKILVDSTCLVDQLGKNGVVTLISSSASKGDDDENELDYVRMLNGVLPPEIRVLGWSPVT